MALTKQAININFAQGLDLKTDPYQVTLGKFLSLTNSVFTTGGRLTKRNGFGDLTHLPNADQTTLTTLNDNLLATGSSLYAFSEDTNQWLNQGTIQPVELSVMPLTRISTSQSSPDMATAPTGLVCLTYIDNGSIYYSIIDSATGQQIVPRTIITGAVASPRVFLLGKYFIITYVTSTPHLKYIAIPYLMPNSPNAPVDISTTIASASTGYDGYVANNNLYVAWGDNSGAVKAVYITSTLIQSAAISIPTSVSTLMSVTVDTSASTSVVWITFWDSGSTNGYTAAFNQGLAPILAKTQIITTTVINEITSVATNSMLSVFYENNSDYAPPYPGTVKTDFISALTVTQSGTVSSTSIILRSVGLASKAFIDSSSGKIYMLATYGEGNQPTYFLIDSSGNIYMRLAYSNGGGYLTNQVLPSVSSLNSNFLVPYQFKDFLTTVNKSTNPTTGTPVNAIYSQTGINLASFSINNSNQYSSEIAQVLQLTGGQLWMYDGVKPVEHSFHVWPDNVAVVSDSNVSATTHATWSATSNTITVVSATGIIVGMNVTSDTAFIPVNTTVTHISGTTITISNPTTTMATSVLVVFYNRDLAPLTGTSTYNWQFTYEWTDNQGLLHRSAPSIPVVESIAAQAPVGLSGTFTPGSPIVTGVTSTTGLTPGMLVLNDSADIPAGTKILTVDSSTQFTMTANVTGVSPVTEVFITVPINDVTLYVPNLRLTYKTAPNPVRIVGYRWSTAQEIFYQFTSVTSPYVNNPATDYTTIVDTLPDSAILGNAILYTTGGVIENIAAPASITSALFKNRLFIVDAEDPNLLWFSKQVIEGVPVEMSDLLTLYVAPTSGAQGSTGPITALSAMDDKLIIFKRDAIYYITGAGPDNTGANNDFSDPIFVTANVGCANPNSIVLMPNGIMFQSDKGIWLLGRDLSTQYIGAGVEQFNDILVENAKAIPGTNQLRFILANNIMLMYDYYYNQWGTFTSQFAISSTLYHNKHTYLSKFGVVYQETPNTYLDGSSPVLMSFTTSWVNVAGLQGFERLYYMLLLGTYFTPFMLNVGVAYNYNPGPTHMINVLPDNSTPNWGNDTTWGAGSNWGGGQGDGSSMDASANVFQARLFPDQQKCEAFQLSVQEVYDSTQGMPAGQGLTLSGLNLVIGTKKGFRTQRSSRSFG